MCMYLTEKNAFGERLLAQVSLISRQQHRKFRSFLWRRVLYLSTHTWVRIAMFVRRTKELGLERTWRGHPRE